MLFNRLRKHTFHNRYEALAFEYFSALGYVGITHNYRSRCGEIDLIMLDQSTTVFIEVKFRASDHFGSAAQSVTLQKQHKIIQTAQLFLAAFPTYANDCRFDVLAMTKNDQTYHYHHIPSAFIV